MRKIYFFVGGTALIILAASFLWYARLIPGNQPTKEKVYRIGILVRGSGYETAVAGYRRKMKELGYEEGRNVSYDVRFVSAKEEVNGAIQDFIAKGVDLIHTYSTPATQAAYAMTKDMLHPIPVVFGSMGDPLLSGVIKDFGRPGTNVTGVTSLSTELTARRVELVREISPLARRIAMPHTAVENGDVAATRSVTIAQDAAKKLGMTMVLFPVRVKEDNEAAAKKILRKDVDGIIVGGDSLVWSSIEVYIAQAIKEKIPFAAFDLSQVKKGALVGFGPDFAVSGEQAAVLTNQILRGRSPAYIPIEVPRTLLLAINRKTATAIGITFSEAFLKKADVIIDE